MSSNVFERLAELKRALAGDKPFDFDFGQLFELAKVAAPEQRDAVLAALDELIAMSHVDLAGGLAMVAGAIVERGGDPRSFPGAVFDHLLAQLRTITGPDDERELPESYYLLERGAMACLSRSFELRAELPRKPALLASIQRYGERYGFLGKMLRVLDGEPVVVVHPATTRGFRVRIGGISDNFELHYLLRRTLAGNGPDRIPTGMSEGAQSDWQLATWRALLPGHKVDLKNHRDWIWNEGMPAEIPPFEGTRIILVGDDGIERSWNEGQTFSAMLPTMKLEGIMPRAEVETLLSRIADAVGQAG